MGDGSPENEHNEHNAHNSSPKNIIESKILDSADVKEMDYIQSWHLTHLATS
jgi:hypothetical protein